MIKTVGNMIIFNPINFDLTEIFVLKLLYSFRAINGWAMIYIKNNGGKANGMKK